MIPFTDVKPRKECLSVLQPREKHPHLGSDESVQQVRQRAFELYEQHGRQDGYDVEDWLRAEEEVRAQAGATARAA